MSKMPQHTLTTLKIFTNTDEFMPISCLPKGMKDGNIYMPACIWIGPKGNPLLLYSDEVTINVLEMVFNKALRDGNTKATIALLQYAAYNKKEFWKRHKQTALGIQVMAEILGQHE